MPVIVVCTRIAASIELCFDIARDIGFHVHSMADSQERAIAGVTSGHIGLGQEVTWEARHFGIRQHLTSRITQFDRPRHFRDTMVRGAFHCFDHDHDFESQQGSTLMTDRFAYTSPLGFLGRLADVLFLESYMRLIIERRAMAIKAAAEDQSPTNEP
jgi:ligand-binding SRPBCC domain-containing protein